MNDRMKASVALAAIALLVGAAGCNKDSTTTATTTSATSTVTRTTDTFGGTVPIGGSAFHSFAVTVTGTIDVTLTVAEPPSTIVMGLSIGTPADGKCTALAGASTKASAGASAQLSGLVSAGTLCVDVHDVGNQTAPVSYTVTVTHP
jgi:hypothetical protein